MYIMKFTCNEPTRCFRHYVSFFTVHLYNWRLISQQDEMKWNLHLPFELNSFIPTINIHLHVNVKYSRFNLVKNVINLPLRLAHLACSCYSWLWSTTDAFTINSNDTFKQAPEERRKMSNRNSLRPLRNNARNRY